jgi:hypothetical protein
MVTFRPARAEDLVQASEVVYENEIRNDPAPPAFPGGSPMLQHIFQTGTVHVAEENGRILAFAASITRDKATFLTDLFVRPDQQSSRLGQTLLQQVMPVTEDGIRCTMSSTDPRALALYIRSGMRPHWPNFCLRLDGAAPVEQFDTDVEIVEAAPGDPALGEWDAEISGRQRPQEHAYWAGEQQAVPLWFRRGAQTVGYGYARLGAETFWFPQECMLGPIGARTPADATVCVLAAVRWAQQRAKTLRINVPGPHPCLALLLEARFRILYVETHLSSLSTSFFDPHCYIISGSDLL